MSATMTAPPRRSFLRAVIEEARRHARRRRQRYALLILLLSAAAAAAYTSLSGGSGATPSAQAARIDVTVGGPLRKNGSLTVMDVQANAKHEGPAGWYGISTVDAAGRLHTLIRCPNHADWCGDLESIDWAPDGKRLAFGVTSFGAVNPYNGLHVVDLRSGRDRQLVTQGQHREYDWFDLDWAPGGRRLAYSDSGHIAVINADGLRRRILETGTVGHDQSPSWSPDGRWIAFASRLNGVSAVYAIRADGSERRLLARDAGSPAWSPDGTRIAFRAHGGVEFVSPNGRLLSARAPFRVGVAVGISGPPVWSPDGRRIAMSNRSGTWVMNADGSGLRRMTRYSVGMAIGRPPRPAWRPRPDR
jgi:TolB protein